jgi:uncharacterized protein YciI
MAFFAVLSVASHAQPAASPSGYDAQLAKAYGANDNGMRAYVLVILKTGPTRVPDGAERDEMFKGHFANIARRAEEGKLIAAGPLDGVDGWRGLFVFAVPTIEEARELASTDPVIVKGEMVAEYHKLFSSAGLMAIPDLHKKLIKPAK